MVDLSMLYEDRESTHRIIVGEWGVRGTHGHCVWVRG